MIYLPWIMGVYLYTPYVTPVCVGARQGLFLFNTGFQKIYIYF